jgi:hypothetical protein
MTGEEIVHLQNEIQQLEDVFPGQGIAINKKLKMKPLAGWRQRYKNSRHVTKFDDESILLSLKEFAG